MHNCIILISYVLDTSLLHNLHIHISTASQGTQGNQQHENSGFHYNTASVQLTFKKKTEFNTDLNTICTVRDSTVQLTTRLTNRPTLADLTVRLAIQLYNSAYNFG